MNISRFQKQDIIDATAVMTKDLDGLESTMRRAKAAKADLTVHQYRRICCYNRRQLLSWWRDNNLEEYVDLLEQIVPGFWRRISKQQAKLKKQLNKEIADCPVTQRTAIQREDLFYDLLELRLNGMTLDQIGKKYNITRERVRSLLTQGFATKQYRKSSFRSGCIDFVLGVRVSKVEGG